MMNKDIIRPNYYLLPNGVECKDVVSYFPYNLGTAMSYLWRAGRKEGNSVEQDITKAITHLQFELDKINKE